MRHLNGIYTQRHNRIKKIDGPLSIPFIRANEKNPIGYTQQKCCDSWVAMYLYQEKCEHRLIDIAHQFRLNRTGSIPANIAKAKVLISVHP